MVAFQGSLFAAPGGRYARVAMNTPVRREFSYHIPKHAEPVEPGCRVKVTFGRRPIIGVVVAIDDAPPSGVEVERIKDIDSCLDATPLVTPALLRLSRTVADNAYCSWGQALAAMLPAALRHDRTRRTIPTVELIYSPAAEEMQSLEAKFPKQAKAVAYLQQAGGPMEVREFCNRTGLSKSPLTTLNKKEWVKFDKKADVLNPFAAVELVRDTPPQLTGPQQDCVNTINKSIDVQQHQDFLLYGITGSGKTEVYLHALERCLAQGRGGIVLVPEISLTPQTVSRFRARCGEVAVLHSGLTDVERHDQWLAIREGKLRVVVGARSALFAPVQDLGIIIVDEEHESTYKQESTPRYQAREVARERARIEGAVCVLGSATPSLESWQAAKDSPDMQLLRLTERVAGGSLPSVKLVDMRVEKAEKGHWLVVSSQLKYGLKEVLEKKEQAILFLNQRGFSPAWYCRPCGKTISCSTCDVALTYHRWRKKALCHYCLKEEPMPQCCSTCGHKVEMIGVGTERVEDSVQRLFPQARILRMDRDTMLRRESYEQALGDFGDGKYDILLGTQMVAKGLDFPRVTLVGVLNADTALHQPDFRSSERCFNLIAQVAGRAGRSSLGGRVIVQTWMPGHPALLAATKHDYEKFALSELQERKDFSYPPFGDVLRLTFESQHQQRAISVANESCKELRQIVGGGFGKSTEYLGPAPPPIERIRGKYRRQLLIKTTRAELLQLRPLLYKLAEQQGVTVDPL
jgi:primosomal protein N' (replication factor Y)